MGDASEDLQSTEDADYFTLCDGCAQEVHASETSTCPCGLELCEACAFAHQCEAKQP